MEGRKRGRCQSRLSLAACACRADDGVHSRRQRFRVWLFWSWKKKSVCVHVERERNFLYF